MLKWAIRSQVLRLRIWMLFTGQMVVGGCLQPLKIWSGPFGNSGDKLTVP
jgi:hypothetical protein